MALPDEEKARIMDTVGLLIASVEQVTSLYRSPRAEGISVTHLRKKENGMITKLARITILVRDQDEALRFYTEKLGLEKRADMTFGPGARWLTVAPKDQTELEIVLQKPESMMHGEEGAQELTKRIGQGTTWVFFTDDCRKDYETLRFRGVNFVDPPREQMYGLEAIFQDLYGNTFSLVQPS